MATTARTTLISAFQKGLSGLYKRNRTTGKMLLEEAVSEEVAAETALALRVTAVETLVANTKVAANLLGLRALDTSDFVDGQLVSQEDEGLLYRFNRGEPTGSESVPDTVDATDTLGVYHLTVANDLGIHLPVDIIATLKAIPATERAEGMLCLVKANGVGFADIYRFDATSALGDAPPAIVAPDVGAGEWLAVGTGDLKTYFDGLYDALGAAAAVLTVDEAAAINGAAAPAAGNVFATMADIPADELTADELAAVNGAAAPAAGNVFATMADVGAGEGQLIDYAFPMRTPPVGATIGQKCIVADAGTAGVFVGQEGKLATEADGIGGYTFENIVNGDKFYSDTAAWEYSGATLNLTGIKNAFATGPSRTSGILCFSLIDTAPSGGEAVNRAYFVNGLGGGAWGAFTNKIVYLDGDGVTWLDAGYTMPDGAMIAECSSNGSVLRTYSSGVIYFEAGTDGSPSPFDQTGGVGRLTGTISREVLNGSPDPIVVEFFLENCSPSAVAIVGGFGTIISPAADLERVVVMCDGTGAFSLDVTGSTGDVYMKVGDRVTTTTLTITP